MKLTKKQKFPKSPKVEEVVSFDVKTSHTGFPKAPRVKRNLVRLRKF